ncbi:hypothetical protein [Ruminococcus albus]|uniref:Uncharacterized protein n=1 Tax=Ruminococcus albus TaxID=1264 RepID=A0A1I1Q0C5_RUMAL|nr:hypothetical protein [Ruminococcus albus]SFD12683.1 hypothetical protein SAMN02910406_03164 [Ruminococcus albus]
MTPDIYIVPEVYKNFAEWLDSLLDNNEMPEDAIAFNFNLYDEAMEGLVYGIQLAACDRFDPEDETGDWACFMVWDSDEDIFRIDFTEDEEKGFEFVQGVFAAFVKKYLNEGKHSDILLASRGVGIGHVDGDIEIIYVNDKEL